MQHREFKSRSIQQPAWKNHPRIPGALKFYANPTIHPVALMSVIVAYLINIKRKDEMVASKIRGRSSQRPSSHMSAHTVAVAFAPNTLTSRRTGSLGLKSGPFRAVSRCCPRDHLEIKVQNHERDSGILVAVAPINPSG